MDKHLLRVKFIKDFDLAYPNSYVLKGEIGHISNHSPDGHVWIRLDKHHEGFSEWDNQVEFNKDICLDNYDGDMQKFLNDYVKVDNDTNEEKQNFLHCLDNFADAAQDLTDAWVENGFNADADLNTAKFADLIKISFDEWVFELKSVRDEMRADQ